MASVKHTPSGFKYRADSLMIHAMEEGLSAPLELGQDDETMGAEMVGNSAQEMVKGEGRETLMMDDEAGLRRVPELGDHPFNLPSTLKRDAEQKTDEDPRKKVRIVERESPLTIQRNSEKARKNQKILDQMRKYEEWYQVITEEHKVNLENCKRDAAKAIHEAKRGAEEAETRVEELSRQIKEMLKNAREGNARIERAEKAALEAAERAKRAEEETKKANARAERAIVGITSGEGEGETKRELIAMQKQFAPLRKSGRSVKAKIDHSRHFSPLIDEVRNDKGGYESKQSGRSMAAKADHARHSSLPVQEIGNDDGPMGCSGNGNGCNSMDIESGNESEASVNLHALIQQQRMEESQTKFMLQAEETRPTKETSGRSSTVDKQKPRPRLIWNKLKDNAGEVEEAVPKGKPSQRQESNSDDIRRMTKGKGKQRQTEEFIANGNDEDVFYTGSALDQHSNHLYAISNDENMEEPSMAPYLLNEPQERRSKPHVNWSIRNSSSLPQTPVKSHKTSQSQAPHACPPWSKPSSKYDLGNSDRDEEDSHPEDSKSDSGNDLDFRSADSDSGADRKNPQFRGIRKDSNDMIVDNVPGKPQSSQPPAGQIYNREGQEQNWAKKNITWEIPGNPERSHNSAPPPQKFSRPKSGGGERVKIRMPTAAASGDDRRRGRLPSPDSLGNGYTYGRRSVSPDPPGINYTYHRMRSTSPNPPKKYNKYQADRSPSPASEYRTPLPGPSRDHQGRRSLLQHRARWPPSPSPPRDYRYIARESPLPDPPRHGRHRARESPAPSSPSESNSEEDDDDLEKRMTKMYRFQPRQKKFYKQSKQRGYDPEYAKVKTLVRQEMNKLLGIAQNNDIVNIQLATEDDIRDYRDGTGPAPTLHPMRPFLHGNTLVGWNGRLCDLFIKYVKRKAAFQPIDRKTLEIVFENRLDTLKKNLRLLENKSEEEIVEMTKRMGKQQRATTRRDKISHLVEADISQYLLKTHKLWLDRRQICVENLKTPSGRIDQGWEVTLSMVNKLTMAGMSSDESQVDEDNRPYYTVKRRAWRSREISDRLAFIDGQMNKTNGYGGVRPGNPPRKRVRIRGAPVSNRDPPVGCPKNFYSPEWLAMLPNRAYTALKMKKSQQLGETC